MYDGGAGGGGGADAVAALDARGQGWAPGSLLTLGVPLVPQGSEMKYALKRLVTGLGVGREAARPCYSLALAQVRRCVWQGRNHAGQKVGCKDRGHRSCWVRRNPRGF